MASNIKIYTPDLYTKSNQGHTLFQHYSVPHTPYPIDKNDKKKIAKFNFRHTIREVV